MAAGAQGREAAGPWAPGVWRGDSPDENSVLNLNNSPPMAIGSSRKPDDGSRKSPGPGEGYPAFVAESNAGPVSFATGQGPPSGWVPDESREV
jgi:hypothetical protein